MLLERDKQELHRWRLDRKRQSKLRLAQTNLWYLATEILGYGWNPKVGGGLVADDVSVKLGDRSCPRGKGLTERLHKPICGWMQERKAQPFVGIRMARWHHKSTLAVCEMIQDILIRPHVSLLYFHAVDELSSQCLAEVARHCLENDNLRALDPIGVDAEGKPYKAFPRKGTKRFYTYNQMTLFRPRCYYSRFPTLFAKGAGSEVTGVHGSKVYLDDIIGKNDIEDNQLGKKKDWFEHTVMPVVDDMQFRAYWTPWSDWGLQQEWIESSDWHTLSIPAATVEDLAEVDWSKKRVHLTPDYELARPTYGPVEQQDDQRRKLEILKRQMGRNFGPQMMVDPTPDSSRPWDAATCEHIVNIAPSPGVPGAAGPGRFFVLSDPAPYLQGSYKQLGEQKRGDGTKDWWSIALVKLRMRNWKVTATLVYGEHSQEWGHAAGSDRCAQIMRRALSYSNEPPLFFSEDADTYFPYMKMACARHSIPLIVAADGGPLKYREYNPSDRKNASFTQLAEMARKAEFLICEETCCATPEGREFLRGDGSRTGFLTQARSWTKVGKNQNNLRFDDDGDVVARLTDAALLDWLQNEEDEKDPAWQRWWENDSQEEDTYVRRSRYCPI